LAADEGYFDRFDRGVRLTPSRAGASAATAAGVWRVVASAWGAASGAAHQRCPARRREGQADGRSVDGSL